VNYPFKFLKHPLSEMVKVFHIVFAWIHVPETNKPDFKINKNALGLVNCQKDPICRAYVNFWFIYILWLVMLPVNNNRSQYQSFVVVLKKRFL